jgi:hypothetical protein
MGQQYSSSVTTSAWRENAVRDASLNEPSMSQSGPGPGEQELQETKGEPGPDNGQGSTHDDNDNGDDAHDVESGKKKRKKKKKKNATEGDSSNNPDTGAAAGTSAGGEADDHDGITRSGIEPIDTRRSSVASIDVDHVWNEAANYNEADGNESDTPSLTDILKAQQRRRRDSQMSLFSEVSRDEINENMLDMADMLHTSRMQALERRNMLNMYGQSSRRVIKNESIAAVAPPSKHHLGSDSLEDMSHVSTPASNRRCKIISLILVVLLLLGIITALILFFVVF